MIVTIWCLHQVQNKFKKITRMLLNNQEGFYWVTTYLWKDFFNDVYKRLWFFMHIYSDIYIRLLPFWCNPLGCSCITLLTYIYVLGCWENNPMATWKRWSWCKYTSVACKGLSLIKWRSCNSSYSPLITPQLLLSWMKKFAPLHVNKIDDISVQ